MPNTNQPDNQDNLDEVQEDELRRQPEERSAAEQAARQAAGDAVRAGRDKLVQRIAATKVGQAIKSAFTATKGFLAGHLVPVIVIVFLIIVIIGFVGYFMYMPSLIRGKFAEFSGKLMEVFYGDNHRLTVKSIDEEKRIELLQYLNDMGLDVVGYGFAPGVKFEEDGEGKEVIKEYTTHLMTGEEHDSNDSDIEDAKGDLLYYYLMAGERAYTINDDGLDGTLEKLYRLNPGYLLTSKALELLFGQDDAFKGMINITGDEGFDGVEVEIDRENQDLIITKNKNLVDEYEYAFSMGDWTGRYGTPVEFSLALHLATMSSGMMRELITNPNLQTAVSIGLDEVECNINFRFNVKNPDGSVRELMLPFNDPNGNQYALRDKIANNETISEDDISIEGLYYVYKGLEVFKYQVITNTEKLLQRGEDYNSIGIGNISRHLETMEALTGSRDIAVQVGNVDYEQTSSDGKTEYDGDEIVIPVYYRKDDGFSRSTVTANSGAYICQYDKEGERPDESTGKLNASTIPETNQIVNLQYEEVKDQENGENENYFMYKLKNDVEGNDFSDSYEYIPKADKYKLTRDDGSQFDSADVTVYRIRGLETFFGEHTLDTNDIVYLTSHKEAYDAMLEEIDWFISLAIWSNGWDMSEFNYNTSMDNLNQFYASEDSNRNISTVSYYRNLFDQAISGQGDVSLADVYNQLIADYETIKNKSIPVESTQSEVESRLKKLDYEVFTDKVVYFIYEQFNDKMDESGSVVKYVQPYIKSVVKHWFKDVDFMADGVYSESDAAIELAFPAETELPEEVEAVTVLTPKNGGRVSTQMDEPYVIKGDTVLRDGKIVDDHNTSIKDAVNKTVDVSDYNWGDGYRTTKKIFTQGFYYTFDGTADTARSIYFQEELENASYGEIIEFSVSNGRIVKAQRNPQREIIGMDMIFDKNAITIYYEGEDEEELKLYESDNENIRRYSDAKKTNLKVPVKKYIIVYNNSNLEYLSPADNDYQTVKNRVDFINEVWDVVGVQCKRKHLTFDTVVETENADEEHASDAQLMAITGLQLLKNMDTEDADYIYRDLKEMLIELAYYTEAEFDYLDTDKLEWFIPDYQPEVWPQNSDNEILDFAAILYPKEEKDENDDTEPTEEEEFRQTMGLSIDKSQGFDPDLQVIAPGDCIILSAEENEIEIEFRADEQPEIAVLDKYTMIIEGINIEDGITIIDEDENETNISYESAIKNKTRIPVHSVIGKTGKDEIKVYLLNSKGGIISNVDHYMAPEVATVSTQSDSFSITGTVLTKDEFTNCCLSYMSSRGINNSDFSETNLRKFYEICVSSGVNPEFAFVTAIAESGLTAGEATSTHNYWGLDTPNGSSVPSLGTMLETLQKYCDRLVEYQDPTSSFYTMIMAKYEERAACTENGGCNPNGYGKPDTLQGLQSIYSYVGDHVEGGSGTGGYYYLDPGVAGFTGVYSTHQEFLTKCKNNHPYGSKASIWEQAQYTAYQVESKVEKAKEIFGENAGKAIH